VIAALGYLQVGVVARRELDALRGTRLVKGSCVSSGMGRWSCTADIPRSRRAGRSRPAPWDGSSERCLPLRQAPCHDDAAVLGQRLADGVQRLGHAESMKPQVFTITMSASA